MSVSEYIPITLSFIDRWLGGRSPDGDVHVDAFIGAWSDVEEQGEEEGLVREVRGVDIVDVGEGGMELYVSNLRMQVEDICKREMAIENMEEGEEVQNIHFITERLKVLEDAAILHIPEEESKEDFVLPAVIERTEGIDRVGVLEIKLMRERERNVELRLGHIVCMNEFALKKDADDISDVNQKDSCAAGDQSVLVDSLMRNLDTATKQLSTARYIIEFYNSRGDLDGLEMELNTCNEKLNLESMRFVRLELEFIERTERLQAEIVMLSARSFIPGGFPGMV
jgi:hypothetical protein